jgi:hypothetical protein
MPKKQRPSFQKRQKEMARQQKQKEKEARRVERKQMRDAGIVEEEHLEVLTGPPDLSDEPGEGEPDADGDAPADRD